MSPYRPDRNHRYDYSTFDQGATQYEYRSPPRRQRIDPFQNDYREFRRASFNTEASSSRFRHPAYQNQDAAHARHHSSHPNEPPTHPQRWSSRYRPLPARYNHEEDPDQFDAEFPMSCRTRLRESHIDDRVVESLPYSLAAKYLLWRNMIMILTLFDNRACRAVVSLLTQSRTIDENGLYIPSRPPIFSNQQRLHFAACGPLATTRQFWSVFNYTNLKELQPNAFQHVQSYMEEWTDAERVFHKLSDITPPPVNTPVSLHVEARVLFATLDEVGTHYLLHDETARRASHAVERLRAEDRQGRDRSIMTQACDAYAVLNVLRLYNGENPYDLGSNTTPNRLIRPYEEWSEFEKLRGKRHEAAIISIQRRRENIASGQSVEYSGNALKRVVQQLVCNPVIEDVNGKSMVELVNHFDGGIVDRWNRELKNRKQRVVSQFRSKGRARHSGYEHIK